MIKVSGWEYLRLGGQMGILSRVISGDAQLEIDPAAAIRASLETLLEECQKVSLPVSCALIRGRLPKPPTTLGEINILMEAVRAELQTQLFLFIPAHRAKYYELTLPSTVTVAFPTAAQELVLSGNAIAAGFPTASVFHAMRAAETGIHVMARALGVTFSFPIELAEWGKIVAELEPKINELKGGARSTARDEDLRFYSEAAAQFRYFNNGWRIRVSHSRATYEEPQAISLFDHTCDFFQTLATRLREQPS